MRAPALLALPLMVVMALAGCAPADTAPDAVATSEPTPMPTEPASVVPIPSFDVTCAELVPPAALEELYGAPLDEVRPGAADFFGVGAWRVAARQDGALTCEWSLPDASAYQATVLMTAVRGATSGFAESRMIFKESGFPGYPDGRLIFRSLDDEQGSFVAGCRWLWSSAPIGPTCEWSALAGDVWVEARFVDLPAAEVGGALPPDAESSPIAVEPDFTSSVSSQIVRSALVTLENAEDVDQPQPAASRTCDEVAPPTDPAVQALGAPLTGGPIDTSISDPNWWFEYGQAQWKSSASRQGWTRCVGELGNSAKLELISAPGAAWTVDAGASFGPANGFDLAFEDCGA